MKLPEKRCCLEEIKPYVPGKPVEEVERELGLKNVIKLASNENPLGPSPLAIEAMREASPRMSYYPDGNCYYLKQRLAAHLDVGEDHLIFGNGSDEILKLAAETYINSGDEAIIPRPSFSEYEFSVRVAGGTPRFVDLNDDFTYDAGAILKAINERTRMVFVCSPNNPTGTVMSGSELNLLLQGLTSNIVLVMDEAYYEYVSDPGYPESLELVKEGRPVLALRTFSKVYGLAGLRIGYGIAPDYMIRDISRVREPFNVNSMAQTAAKAALDDSDHLLRSRLLVDEGRLQLAEGLQKLGLSPVPTHANFVFVDIKVDSNEAFQLLLKKGVIVRTGDIFGFPTCIRVTFGTREQNTRFLEALQEVLSQLK